MSGTYLSFCVSLSSIGLEILEFNLIKNLRPEMSKRPMGNCPLFILWNLRRRLISSNHISLEITLRKPLGNLNELIAEEKGENINEINALNHLISSELFNFSSLIINQIAPENKVQWVEIFFPSILSPFNVSEHEKIGSTWNIMKSMYTNSLS